MLVFGGEGEKEAAVNWRDEAMLRTGIKTGKPALAESPYRFEAPYRSIAAGEEKTYEAVYEAHFIPSPNGKIYLAAYLIAPRGAREEAARELSALIQSLGWRKDVSAALENTLLYRNAMEEWTRLVPKARYEDTAKQLAGLKGYLAQFFLEPSLTILPSHHLLQDQAYVESFNDSYEQYGEGFDKGKVLSLYHEILKQRSSYLKARWGLMGLYLHMKDYEAALHEIEAIISYTPFDGGPYLEKARILENLEKKSEARSAYEKALELWTGQDQERGEIKEHIKALKL